MAAVASIFCCLAAYPINQCCEQGIWCLDGQSSLRREFGPLSIDDEAHRAWLHGQPLDLPQREWAILGFFLDHPEKVLSKERIVAAVCSWDKDMSVNAVEVYVSRLRTKLEPAGIRIRTIRGLGYMLEDLPHDAKPA